jgi:hypothetical protein
VLFWIATVVPLAAAVGLALSGHTVAAGIVAGIGFTVLMGVFVLWEEFRPRRRASRP